MEIDCFRLKSHIDKQDLSVSPSVHCQCPFAQNGHRCVVVVIARQGKVDQIVDSQECAQKDRFPKET